MGILTKEVEVNPSGKMIQYYKNLGYEAKYHKPLIVEVKDLPKRSHAIIEVLCDMCNKNKITTTYDTYNRVIDNTGSCVCKKCAQKKISQVVQERYGVPIASQSKIFKEKVKQTNLEKYGVENIMHNADIKERIKQSNFQKHGVACTLQIPEVRAKAVATYYKNSTQKTSKQQLYIYNLYSTVANVKLNYPIKYYAIDICFPEENLIVEYDGGGHDLRVTLGRLTQEEFDQKELIRNNIIKREGYTRINIVSKKDLLPSDPILLQMLQDARNYFSKYPNHSWIEFNIDTSSIRSAEYKDGISYDYGELRIIKE